MSLSELQVVIQKVYEYSDTNNIEKVVFYWQGGEVLPLVLLGLKGCTK
jgi:sulfatase maturation enzyme AslB (radical SAM superfamily)